MLAQPAGRSPSNGLPRFAELGTRLDVDLVVGRMVNLFLRSCVAASLRSPESSIDHTDSELLLACYYDLSPEPIDRRLVRRMTPESSAIPAVFID